VNVQERKELALRLRERGEYEAASATLREAIAEAQGHEELAELYGALGGTLRGHGQLVDAIQAYDAGSRYEPTDNTYNELNRLVTRILLEPRSLTDREALLGHGDVAAVDVPGRLVELLARLRRRVEDTRDEDDWGLGDLALVSALTGDAAGTAAALERLEQVPPPREVYAKYRDTFAALASLDTTRQRIFHDARSWLAQRA
jgi:hypothetical protein